MRLHTTTTNNNKNQPHALARPLPKGLRTLPRPSVSHHSQKRAHALPRTKMWRASLDLGIIMDERAAWRAK